ncbi:hypothetical protein DPMN_055865 [Dreissena polymorpha]|uniref:Uncharacterized protein n=1 Tax=Dreissena polymorpha TaxID=45954 RepID=A0A9D4CRH8_DREPO|nr:hypothetical protein DPMN_055865 [Dreissena polymorpha]
MWWLSEIYSCRGTVGWIIREVNNVVPLAQVAIQVLKNNDTPGLENTDRAVPVQDRNILFKEQQCAEEDFRFIRT